MNVVQTFSLLMWATIGLCLFLFSPSRSYRKKVGGMSRAEIDVFWQRKKAEDGTLGCRMLLWLLGAIFEFIQKFVVEPIYLIWALLSHTGQIEFAYGAMLALLQNIAITLIVLLVRKARAEQAYPKDSWGKRALSFIDFLPTLYLWYLFGVVVGILH